MAIEIRNISRDQDIKVFDISGLPYEVLKDKITWKRTCYFESFAGVFAVVLNEECDLFYREIEQLGDMKKCISEDEEGGILYDVSIDIEWNRNFNVKECSIEHDVGLFIITPKYNYYEVAKLEVTKNPIHSYSWDMIVLPKKLVCIVHIDVFGKFARSMVDMGIAKRFVYGYD